MGDIVEGGEFMFHRVAAPGMIFAAVDEAVDSPRAGPHKISASFVIIGVFHGNRGEFYDCFQKDFHKAVQHIEVVIHMEIDLEDMRHDIHTAASSLIGADGESI